MRRAVLLCSMLAGSCLSLAQPGTPYFERVLARELPGARILALAEDPWGAIWVGTSNGVGRIVGDQVRIWRHSAADSASLVANEVTSIDATDSARVWVGTVRGLCSIDPVTGSVERHPVVPQDGAPPVDQAVWQAARGQGDVLWVALSNGLRCYRISERRWTMPSVEQRLYPGEPFKGVPHAMAWDRARRVLWAGTKNGLYRIPASAAEERRHRESLDPYGLSTHVSCLHMDAAGTLWMNDPERYAVSILRAGTEELQQIALPKGMDEGNINRAILADARGGLWLAGNDDVLYWRDARATEWQSITHDPRHRWSPSSTSVHALLQARTGVIWVGSEEGLLRVVPEHAAQELVVAWEPPRIVNRMLAHGGDVLLATNGAGVLRLVGGRRRLEVEPMERTARGQAIQPGRMEDMVNDLAVVGDRLLLGTKAGVRYVPEPTGTNLPGIVAPESRPRGKYTLQVLADARGTSWMLTWNHGLWWLGANESEPHQFKVPGNPDGAIGRIAAIAAHASGGVLCGTTEGLVLWVDERGERGRAPVLSDGSHPGVSALAVSPAGSRWIGLDDGRLVLAAPSGTVERIWSEANGLPGGAIHAIEPRGAGEAWVLTDGGIARVQIPGTVEPIALLEHWGRPTAILAESDGALLVACTKAIIRLPRSAGRVSPSAPRAAIAAVLSGGVHLPAHPFSAALEVPYDKRSLSLRVSSLGAAVPERALLRYRLNPDRPWIELGTARTIDLPNLREGRYAIAFALLGSDDHPATLLLTIRPPWFRSTAAIIAGIALLIILSIATARSWLAHKLRIERERSAREKALLEERVRIAHDLHDDLGSGLAMIAMEGELARMDDRGDAREALKRMSEGTREITDSMRRIVWALGSGQDTVGDLAAYIRSSAAELMDRAEIRLASEARITDPQRRLTADQRRHLLLIAKELLLNAIKHAKAGTVRIVLADEGDMLLLRVSDDGQGFDPDERLGAGTGTTSIGNRVKALGGTWLVRSTKGHGTTVEVRMPLTPVAV